MCNICQFYYFFEKITPYSCATPHFLIDVQQKKILKKINPNEISQNLNFALQTTYRESDIFIHKIKKIVLPFENLIFTKKTSNFSNY